MKKLILSILLVSLLLSFFGFVNQSYAFNGFKLVLQVCDDKGNEATAGFEAETPEIRSGSYEKIYWSPWAMDDNEFDPDAIRIQLYPLSGAGGLRNTDIRLAIQLSDDKSSKEKGIVRYTPWASSGGGWSVWATDLNGEDPDAFRIGIQTKYRQNLIIYNLIIGIQLSDDAAKGEFGIAKYTPSASSGGGWSEWATDLNAYDPDAARIYLGARYIKPGVRCGYDKESGWYKFFDCDLECISGRYVKNWIGDGICDQGAYGANFYCPEFDYDEGDCD